MKKFMKLAAVLLAAAMLLALCACGKEPEAENTYKTITPGVLTVATSPDYAPYEFYAIGADGTAELAGFDIALIKYIADYLKLELEIIPMDFDGVLLELANGSVDLGVAGISPDPDRAESMDFSDIYYDWAFMRSMKNPRAVAEATVGGKPAGMIELAPESGEKEGYGHIAFLCMDEEFRHRGFGIQLIGHAISFYRPLGRKKLRLNVAADNVNAVKFYVKCGFTEARREQGSFGEVIVMEKGIALP